MSDRDRETEVEKQRQIHRVRDIERKRDKDRKRQETEIEKTEIERTEKWMQYCERRVGECGKVIETKKQLKIENK